MPPPQWRIARLAEQIRSEVAEIVEGDLKDPRVGFATVTHVDLSPDLRRVRVLVTVLGDDAARQATLEGLAAAVGFVSHELARRLNLRRAPEVVFVPDRGAEAEQRVKDLLPNLGRGEDD